MYPTHQINVTMAESRYMMDLHIPHRSLINSMIPFPVTVTSVNRFNPDGVADFEPHPGNHPAHATHDHQAGHAKSCA